MTAAGQQTPDEGLSTLDRLSAWILRPRVLLSAVAALSVLFVVLGVVLWLAAANEGDKGSEVGAGLITGGVIGILVFVGEWAREDLNREREARQGLGNTGLAPLPDAEQVLPPDLEDAEP